MIDNIGLGACQNKKINSELVRFVLVVHPYRTIPGPTRNSSFVERQICFWNKICVWRSIQFIDGCTKVVTLVGFSIGQSFVFWMEGSPNLLEAIEGHSKLLVDLSDKAPAVRQLKEIVLVPGEGNGDVVIAKIGTVPTTVCGY